MQRAADHKMSSDTTPIPQNQETSWKTIGKTERAK